MSRLVIYICRDEDEETVDQGEESASLWHRIRRPTGSVRGRLNGRVTVLKGHIPGYGAVKVVVRVDRLRIVLRRGLRWDGGEGRDRR